MNLVNEILECLSHLQNSTKCSICNENLRELVRIRICGHYFCSDCLRFAKPSGTCPKCDIVYEIVHLDHENLAKSCEKELSELTELLNTAKNGNMMPPKSFSSSTNSSTDLFELNLNQSSSKSSESRLDTTIFYNGNKYHVNFLTVANKVNEKGETPLHLACKRNKLAEVRALIEAKADINAKDYAGWAPLHEAVQSQNLEIVQYLLKSGCLTDVPGPEFVTPLHQAASLDNHDIVRILLKYGANKYAVDYAGKRPLDCTDDQLIKETLQSYNVIDVRIKQFEVFLSAKVSLYCHSVDQAIKEKLKNCTNIQVVEKMDSKKHLTHFVIKRSHKISFKIMQAMLEGLQFLTEDTVDSYLQGNYFIDIPKYSFIGDKRLNEGIRKSMLGALLKLPKLFEGINFYIEDHTTAVDVYHLKVDKEYLCKLIKIGGGKLLHRPPAERTCNDEDGHPFFAKATSTICQCCNFIIYEESNCPGSLYNMAKLQHKSSKWLIDCVVRYEIDD